MRKLTKIVLLIALIAVVAPFMLPGPNGGRLLSWEELHWPELGWPDWEAPSAAALWDSVVDWMAGLGTDRAEPGTAFKWQDADGVWHYGDEPPPGVSAEPVELHPDVNIVPATPADGEGEASQQRAPVAEEDPPEEQPTAAPDGDAQGPLERAREAAAKSEDRKRRIDEAVRANSGGD